MSCLGQNQGRRTGFPGIFGGRVHDDTDIRGYYTMTPSIDRIVADYGRRD